MDDANSNTYDKLLESARQGNNLLLLGAGGTGKCLDPQTEILLYNGAIKIAKDIIDGDLLMGEDSTPRTVLSTCTGEDDMYRIDTSYGDSFTVNSHHILTLKYSHNEENIIDIPILEYLEKPSEWKDLYKAFKVPVEFPKTNTNLSDPYSVGLNVSFVEIPDRYLRGPKDIRMKVLAGILDSIGVITSPCFYKIEITNKNKKIMDSIIFLTRSLGFACYHESEKIGTNAYIFGKGLEYVPMLIKSQKSSSYDQMDSLILGMEITFIGKGKYCGFTLDGNGRFVLGNFIVTHNTYMLRQLAKDLTELGKKVAMTATTGVAAVGLNIPECKLNARTFHSWSGIGLGKESKEKLLEGCKRFKGCFNRWNYTDVLFLDEVSMFGGELFQKIDYIARNIRNTYDIPFGGLQLVISGDFLQLPPVKDEWIFTTEEWDDLALESFTLTEPKRYDDIEWFHTLLRIRKGKPSKADLELLKSREKAYNDLHLDTMDIKPTILFSKRIDVSSMNDREMAKLPGEEINFIANDSFNPIKRGTKFGKYEKQLEEAAPTSIKLKVGSQVMLKTNLDVSTGLVNGSRGVILQMTESNVLVKFTNNLEIRIEKNNWEIIDSEGVAVRWQIPLILAWSLTTHKSQGATLDYAICDVGPSIFAPGQAYVALSRVRNKNGLFLSSFYKKSIMVDKQALEYSLELEEMEKLAFEESIM